LAARTSSWLSASTPAQQARKPGRSGPPKVICCPSAIVSTPTLTPPPASGAPAVTCGGPGVSTGCGSAVGAGPSRACTRATNPATRCAFHGDQAEALVAAPSACASACSSSSTAGSEPMVAATRSIVAGSSMSRRVAVSGSRRWWRTRVPIVATSGAPKPIRVAMAAAIGSPATLWSPGQPFPMSCSSAATSSRSGRSTSCVSSAAAAAHSTRCRSTV
jgi:hypothetical protein